MAGNCGDELPTDYRCPKGCPSLAQLGHCEDQWTGEHVGQCSMARGTVKDFCKKSCNNCGTHISRSKDLPITSTDDFRDVIK